MSQYSSYPKLSEGNPVGFCSLLSVACWACCSHPPTPPIAIMYCSSPLMISVTGAKWRACHGHHQRWKQLLSMLQLVAKLLRHFAKFWNLRDELCTGAEKYAVCKISPPPPNQCWSLFLALWSLLVWPTLPRGEGRCFTQGCEDIKHLQKTVKVSQQFWNGS